jgi:hypothetical protein
LNETIYLPSPSTEHTANTIEMNSIPSISDKRSGDENDEPRSVKRLRSSFLQSDNSTTMIKWIPPSKQFVTSLHTQSSSLFQFILLLIHTILTSSDNHLTDEHCRWLHSTVHLYEQNYNIDKLSILIETACKVVKTNLVR